MKNLFASLLAFALILVTASAVSAKDEKDDAIVFTSIVYFYPNSTPPSQTQLSTHLKNFTRIEDRPDKIDKPYLRFSIMEDFAGSYAVPDLEYLQYAGRGLSKAQADDIQNSKQLLHLGIAFPKAGSLPNYAAINKFLYDIATEHGGVIWDSETRELFEPAAWKDRRLAANAGGIPNITNHITIHAYNNEGDDGIRAITLGMVKFGLPDVVVNNFSWSLGKPMGNLINLASQSLLEGQSPDKKSRLTLNISKLQNSGMKQKLNESLIDNAASELKIKTGEAKWEEGDPDNALLEILFDQAKGDNLSEQQESTVSALFGWKDSIAYVAHEDDVLAASARAKAKLNGLRKAFRKGLQPGEFIQLKAPFTRTDGGNEWMWVEVLTWDKTTIKGLLKNEPHDVPELRAGSEVIIDQNDVFDYIRLYADGTSEGNETAKLMRRN